MSKHPHAELMAQYAQDALETDTPWERWEVRQVAKGCEPSDWRPCMPRDMLFPRDFEYRRKPEPDHAEIYTYTHKFTHFYGEEAETVDSILNASHISIYKVDEHGFESLVYDMELPETLLAIFNTHQTAVELYDQL